MKGILRTKDIPKLIFLNSIRYLIPYLPLRLKHLLAEWIAVITSKGIKAAKIKTALEELFGKELFPQEQMKKIVRETLSNVRKDMFEMWSFPVLKNEDIEDLCYIDGMDHLYCILKKGKGVIIALCHFGSYKMILPCLGSKGYKITQVAVNPLDFTDDNASVIKNKIMEIEYTCEKSLRANFIYMGSSARQIFRVLQNNEILVISVDGIADPKRITLPFFDRKIRLSPAVVRIASKLDSPVLPVFTVREKDNRHRIIILEEMTIDKDAENKEELFLKNFAYLMESYITKYPGHYAWFVYKNKTEPPAIGSVFTD